MLTHTSPMSWLPLNRLLISARLKSGKTSDKSWSFSILVTQATFPVARRMCTSAHCVHQQLQRLALKMLVSLFLAFNPGEKKKQLNSRLEIVAVRFCSNTNVHVSHKNKPSNSSSTACSFSPLLSNDDLCLKSEELVPTKLSFDNVRPRSSRLN